MLAGLPPVPEGPATVTQGGGENRQQRAESRHFTGDTGPSKSEKMFSMDATDATDATNTVALVAKDVPQVSGDLAQSVAPVASGTFDEELVDAVPEDICERDEREEAEMLRRKQVYHLKSSDTLVTRNTIVTPFGHHSNTVVIRL
jgi:hypothetical protein